METIWNTSIIRKHLRNGGFGLEKESLRVTPTGNLAHTDHPFPDNPNMDRDFCENQTELITDVCSSVDEVWEAMSALHKKAVKVLLHRESGTEYLWPFSNPPYVLGEDDIPVAHFEGDLAVKEKYRMYLAGKYGKKKMLFSGIHYNLSFSDDVLKETWNNQIYPTFQDYKNRVYLDLAKKVTKYSWLIVYLTAASPLMDGSFLKDENLGKDVLSRYASARCSDIGYWNEFIPELDYRSLDIYIDSIQAYVNAGKLKQASELYYPVRLKPRGANSLENLRERGVNHIELRMFDLNPLSPVGIMKEDLAFVHLFMIYLLTLPALEFGSYDQIAAIRNEKRAAGYEDKTIWIENKWCETPLLVRDAVIEIIEDMEILFEDIDDPKIAETLEFQKEKVLHPEKRYAHVLRNMCSPGYVRKGLNLVKNYALAIDAE